MQLKDTNGNKYIADKMKNKSSHFFYKMKITRNRGIRK